MMTWILGKIVELLESGETNWRTEKCGRKTLNNSAKSASEIPPLYQGCSREKAIQEAIDLQEKGLVKINWLIRGSDIKSLVFHLEDRDQFYQLYRENVKTEVYSQTTEIVEVSGIFEKRNVCGSKTMDPELLCGSSGKI